MSQTDSEAARARRRERARLILDTATWCYFGALVVAAWHLLMLGHVPLLTWAVVLSAPSAAALLYVLVSMFVPSLHAGRRIGFPINLTLPAVFTALLLLCAVLSTRVGSSLIQQPDAINAMSALTHWKVLFSSYLLGVGLLTLVGIRDRNRAAKPDEDPAPTVDSD